MALVAQVRKPEEREVLTRRHGRLRRFMRGQGLNCQTIAPTPLRSMIWSNLANTDWLILALRIRIAERTSDRTNDGAPGGAVSLRDETITCS